jgi:hypothetical protein
MSERVAARLLRNPSICSRICEGERTLKYLTLLGRSSGALHHRNWDMQQCLARDRVTAKLSATAGAMSRASIFSVIISRSPNLRNDCEGQHSIVYIYGAASGLNQCRR